MIRIACFGRLKMLVKLGLTFVVIAAIGLYYVADNNDGKLELFGWKLEFDSLNMGVPKEAKEVKVDEGIPAGKSQVGAKGKVELKAKEDLKTQVVDEDKKTVKGDNSLEKTDPKLTDEDSKKEPKLTDNKKKVTSRKVETPEKKDPKPAQNVEPTEKSKPVKESKKEDMPEQIIPRVKSEPDVEINKESNIPQQEEIKAKDNVVKDTKAAQNDKKPEMNDEKLRKTEGAQKKLDSSKEEVAKTADTKTADTKTADIKMAVTKTADTKTADIKTADTKTADIKTADTKTADTKTADTKTADAKTADIKTADIKMADIKTADTKTADTKTADIKTADIKMADIKTADTKTADTKTADTKTADGPFADDDDMHLSVVACGDRLEESLVMIKSAVIFSRAKLHVHIFADDDLRPKFKQQLDAYPAEVKQRFEAHIYPIQFPKSQKADEWKTLFKPCATQRLFIPELLTSVRRLIYVDTDILFLRPLDDLWAMYKDFNSSQIVALAWEHEDGTAGWYNRFARHPYYPPFGVNSGVMLMDLPGLRASNWVNLMKEYYREYRLRITWGDQDLINIFFHHYPEKLYVFRCPYNYRPDHCMYMQICRPANQQGISVLHGSRQTYHNEKQLTFRAVYETFRDYKFGQSLDHHLLEEMESRLDDIVPSKDRCANNRDLFTKQLENSVKDVLKGR